MDPSAHASGGVKATISSDGSNNVEIISCKPNLALTTM